MPYRPKQFRPQHQPAGEQRPSSTKRGYDRAWQKLRLQHLRQNPLCVFCLKQGKTVAATVADHVKPIAVAPHLRLDPANIRSCCTDCHAKITANFKTTGVNEMPLALGGWA